MNKCLHLAMLALALLLMISCKPKVPGKVIQPGKMEDILYDYHLAQAAAEQAQNGKMDYNKHLYFDAVLDKYDVTEAQFDSSMVYYQRHTEGLYKIYDNINKRLQNEAGATIESQNNGKYANLAENSDTALIWKGNASEFLLSSAPLNKMTFYMKTDSSYHAGDAIEFSFDAQFLVQDGTRDAVALLAIRYDNDSVATQNVHMSSDSHYTMMVPSFPKHRIKELRGFIYLSAGNGAMSTLKMVCISNITMARFRQSAKTVTGGSGQTALPSQQRSQPGGAPFGNGMPPGVSQPPSSPNGSMPTNGNVPPSTGMPPTDKPSMVR